MKQYNQQITSELNKLVEHILSSKLSRKEIAKMIRIFKENLKRPTNELRERLQVDAHDSAIEAQHKAKKLLMLLSQDAMLQSLTVDEVDKLVDRVFTKDLVFTKFSKGKLISYTANMNDVINRLPDNVSDKIRSSILASYISGDTPAQTASNVLGNANKKQIRRNLKTIASTIIYQARMDANLESLETNHKYFSHYVYKTAKDEKVDHICRPMDGKTWDKLSDIPENEKPLRHYNCRCNIMPVA